MSFSPNTHPIDGTWERWCGKRGLVLVLILAVGLRFVAITRQPPGVEIDGLGYWTMASHWIDGHGMRDNAGNHAFLNAGYPLFLAGLFALFGTSLKVAVYANLGLAGGAVGLCYLLGRQLGGKRVGLLAALFWALYLPSIAYTSYLAKENLQIPLALAILGLGVSWNRSPLAIWRAPLLGAISGYSLLVAATGAIFGVLLFGWMLVRLPLREKLLQGALWVLLAGAVASPWILRNQRILGAPVLNTNSGLNLLLGNRPGAGPTYRGLEGTEFQAEWQSVRANQGELAVDQLARERAWEYIRQHPGETAKRWAERLWWFWSPPEVHQEGATALETNLRRVWWLQYVGLLFAALWAWRIPKAAFLLGFALLVWDLVHAPFFVMARFQLPIMPLVCILAAIGCLGWPSFGRSSPKNRAPLPG